MQNIFDQYFNPKSICIIGASSKPGSLGYELTKSVKQYGYTGKLFLINPKSEDILGFKCYSSLKEIKEQIDVAIVMVPKKFAEATIADVLDKGTKAVILITAGFKETGKEGEEAEKKILRMVKNAGGCDWCSSAQFIKGNRYTLFTIY
jgi:acetyltransferase